MGQGWGRIKEKIGFEKREISFDGLEEDVGWPKNNEKSVRHFHYR